MKQRERKFTERKIGQQSSVFGPRSILGPSPLITRHCVYIGMGSNMGDRILNCRRAIAAIASSKENRILRCSPFYETEPIGKKEQGWFINGVIALETSLPPHGLMDLLLGIENRLGRVRIEKWGPRPIDLDILFYGNEVINEKDLQIPHPQVPERLFVLAPLADIAPDLRHPVLNQTVRKMRGALKGNEKVIRLSCSSELLKPCTV